MKLSEERRQKLYDAIHAPITDLRVKLQLDGQHADQKLDFELAKLVDEIWQKQKRVLGIVEWSK